MSRWRPGAGREQPSEIAQPGGAEERIGHRVEDDIPVRVAGEPRRTVDRDPAEDEGHPRAEGMEVVADADARWSRDRRARPATERRLDPGQVAGQRHLEVGGIAGDCMDGNCTGLQQGGLIGPGLGAARREARRTPAAAVPRRTPCGVCAAASPNRSTVSMIRSPAIRLSVSADRHDRDDGSLLRGRGGDPRDQLRRHERARAVVDEDDPVIG